MNPALTRQISELADFGWEVKSQTDSTAALGMRHPFGWWWFALWFIVFLGWGAIMYTAWWLSTSKKSLFLAADGDSVSMSGDVFYVEHQQAQAEAIRRQRQDIQEQGFLRAIVPSIIAFLAVIAFWFFIIWLIVQIFD